MDVLDRLFRRLVERLRRERGGAGPEPLTVGEIYQQLVPYRVVRGELGISELAEYEHTLLRLLSGERGYVSLDPAEAQEELRRELGAPNPILGLYRDYSEAAARLDLRRVPLPAPAAPPPPEVTQPFPSAPAAQEEAPPPPEPLPVLEPPPPVPCRVCSAPLPEGREVRYCPHCGAVQRAIPCRSCGEPVEPEWKFCVGCGVPQQVAASS